MGDGNASAIRMGANNAERVEPGPGVDMSVDRSEHRVLHELHDLSGAEQRRFLQSMDSFDAGTHRYHDPVVLYPFLGSSLHRFSSLLSRALSARNSASMVESGDGVGISTNRRDGS